MDSDEEALSQGSAEEYDGMDYVSDSSESTMSSLEGYDGMDYSSDSEATMSPLEEDMNINIDDVQVPTYQPFFKFDPIKFRIIEGEQPDDDTLNYVGKFFMELCTTFTSHQTYVSLIHRFKNENVLLNVHQKFPGSKDAFWKKIERNRENIYRSVHCGECFVKVGETDKKITNDCECQLCGPDRPNKKLGYFAGINLRAQLIELLRRPNMLSSLNYRFTREKWQEDAMEDFFDGELYQELLRGFLADPNNYTFMLWIDGVSLGRTTKKSAYPILLIINELPPHARKRHILLVGVWIGHHQPDFNVVADKMIEELQDLYNTGVRWIPHEGGEERISKFAVCVLSCDTEARYKLLGCMRHNTRNFGCTYCYVQGETVRGKALYAYNNTAPLRTDQEMRDDLQLYLQRCANHREGQPAVEPVHGIYKESFLSRLPGFDLARGVVVDAFHNSYEGNFEKVMLHFFEDAGKRWYVGDPVNKAMINERLDKIKMPSRVSRSTRGLDVISYWTGTEKRNFVIYLAPVVLFGILPQEFHRFLVTLSEASFLLNKHSTTREEIRRADRMLTDFTRNYQKYFGIEDMTYNRHLTLHNVKSVRTCGNYWVHSGATFESWNRLLLSNITSPNARCLQTVDRYLMMKFLEDVSNNEILTEAVRNRMQEQLRKAQWKDPPLVSTGRSFKETSDKRERLATAEEIQLIQDSGIDVQGDIRLSMYKTAQIHGAKYRVKQIFLLKKLT